VDAVRRALFAVAKFRRPSPLAPIMRPVSGRGSRTNQLPTLRVTTVPASSSSYLKVFQPSPQPSLDIGEGNDRADMDRLCRAFSTATGITLRFLDSDSGADESPLDWSAPVYSNVGTSPGKLCIARLQGKGATPFSEADLATQELVESLSEMISTKLQATAALTEREAELAACVPVVPHRAESAQLAERLSAVLQGGAQSLKCQAAGVYLLDDATSQLKLRSMWGLPKSRLADPPRPLAGAIGDLEALAGHAVVLEDNLLFDTWQVPERCAAAVCVPISTPTTILGTLWLYSTTARDFSEEETNLAEILAGRIASDLERDMLLREGTQNRHATHELASAAEIAQLATPNVAPMVEGWEIAGCVVTSRDGEIPAAQFFDWRAGNGESLDLILGSLGDPSLAAAMQAVEVRSCWRADASATTAHSLGQGMQPANASDSTTLTAASLPTFVGLHVEPEVPLVRYTATGSPLALIHRAGEFTWHDLAATADEETVPLAPGESLILFAGDDDLIARRMTLLEGLQSGEEDEPRWSAQAIANRLASLGAVPPSSDSAAGCGVLVLRAR